MNTYLEHPAQPSQAMVQTINSLETNGFTFRYLKPMTDHPGTQFQAHFARPTPHGVLTFSLQIDIEGNITSH